LKRPLATAVKQRFQYPLFIFHLGLVPQIYRSRLLGIISQLSNEKKGFVDSVTWIAVLYEMASNEGFAQNDNPESPQDGTNKISFPRTKSSITILRFPSN
jgi:hypothetical protein